MTKIADKPPAFCAACFRAGSDKRYVDFEAAYDGPVIPGSPANQPVDDLVLCEDCLATAFSLLDPQGKDERIAELEGAVVELTNDNEAKDRMVQGFRRSVNELVDHPVKSFPGRPKLEGIDKETANKLNKGVFERNKTTSDPLQHKREKAKV